MGGLANLVGTVGVMMVLYAFYELQARRAEHDSPRYLWLNLGGAILIILSLLKHWNLPSFLIEVAWISISAYGLVKGRKKKKRTKGKGTK